MFIILRHYSNEDISEFDKIEIGKKTFASIKEACEYALNWAESEKDEGRELKKARIDSLDWVLDSLPVAVVGYENADGEFNVFHDIYAVIKVDN